MNESFAKTTCIELINALANAVICSSAADRAADLYVRRIAISYNSAANSFRALFSKVYSRSLRGQSLRCSDYL